MLHIVSNILYKKKIIKYLLKIILYFLITQLEAILNLILFVLLYSYKFIKKLIIKEPSNLEKFKLLIYNNKVNILNNLFFLILDPVILGYYFLGLITFFSLIIRNEKDWLLAAIVALLKIFTILIN